jgi:hypothetical protein
MRPARSAAFVATRRERGVHHGQRVRAWENMFVYGDVEKANNFFPHGFLPRFVVHGCTRSPSSSTHRGPSAQGRGGRGHQRLSRRPGERRRSHRMAQYLALTEAMVRDPRPGKASTCCRTTTPAARTGRSSCHEDQVPDRADGGSPSAKLTRTRSNPDIRLYIDAGAAATATRPSSGSSHEALVGLPRHGVRRATEPAGIN